VLRNAVRDVGGSCVIESAPPQAKVGTDVFGENSDALPISRALKQRFDPGGVLNPGRFIGGI
jgi:glycolate oxidase FAD binding subunit